MNISSSAVACGRTSTAGIMLSHIQEAVGNSWDNLNAILGHKLISFESYKQGHIKR